MVHPLLDKLMIGLTVGGLVLLPVLGVVLLKGPKRRVGLAILVSLGVGLSLTLTFQFLALRPRPEAVRLLLPLPDFPSYPSGHSAAAFGTALVVGLSYRRRRWWALALTGASLIAFSRVYVGHHYPSDILGGAVLGASVGAVCFGLFVGHTRAGGYSSQSSGPKLVITAQMEKPLAKPSQFYWRWLLWLQVALALIVTHMAYLDILPSALLRWPLADKALHFLLIGSIAFWLNLWLSGRTITVGLWPIPLALLIPLSLALLEEGLQFLSPVRSADLGDLLSDLAGLLFFWWLSQKLIKSGQPSQQLSKT